MTDRSILWTRDLNDTTTDLCTSHRGLSGRKGLLKGVKNILCIFDRNRTDLWQ